MYVIWKKRCIYTLNVIMVQRKSIGVPWIEYNSEILKYLYNIRYNHEWLLRKLSYSTKILHKLQMPTRFADHQRPCKASRAKQNTTKKYKKHHLNRYTWKLIQSWLIITLKSLNTLKFSTVGVKARPSMLLYKVRKLYSWLNPHHTLLWENFEQNKSTLCEVNA